MASNKVKIIAGQWRGRNLPFPDIKGLRPTPVRVRETVFNWLQYDVIASRCLDLYAGSGALGMEAASRGAKAVVQVDDDAQVCRQLKQNAELVSASQVKIVQQDVFRYLAGNAQMFDLVFLDPPFAKGYAVQAANWLEEKLWLANHAKIYIEVENTLKLTGLPENWKMLKHKKAGEVAYYLFERID
ncbi:MAG: 16S rRNA (guanine(966)-N(2))-methyltransferase RsmD [Methyloprofundus sp.]|uniref:16S rRNA (guanine(966)-N(2))-methyltransferase RsmD n=1 Tax=Methyloprofundus sp. TaxID=2020875 RepID=UPI002602381F|nr:16S rRNA (guanine(966)-N(2))-methyltransferase RsmD [Methyloprofundus sp.]